MIIYIPIKKIAFKKPKIKQKNNFKYFEKKLLTYMVIWCTIIDIRVVTDTIVERQEGGNMRKAIRFSVDDTVAMEVAMELASIEAEAELKKAQAKADAQVRANSDFEYLSESDKALCNLITEGKACLLESWKKGTLTDKQIENFSDMEKAVYGVATWSGYIKRWRMQSGLKG